MLSVEIWDDFIMLKINDRLPMFAESAKDVQNDALREGARDIVVLAKNRAPKLTGGLRSDSDVRMVKQLWWRVGFWKEYAIFQEMKNYKKYTTPNTGRRFLKGSGDAVSESMPMKFKKHGGRA
jgi:hypothetical protein